MQTIMTIVEPLVVLCTAPDQKTAEKLARLLVEKKLAACVNIIANITSVYQWQEKLITDNEHLLIIKTTQLKYSRVEAELQQAHPYSVPEIMALPIQQGAENYLNWLVGSLK